MCQVSINGIFRKSEPVKIHCSVFADFHALAPEQNALFVEAVAPERDAGSSLLFPLRENAMPGEFRYHRAGMKDAHDLSGSVRQARQLRDSSIRRNLPCRDGTERRLDRESQGRNSCLPWIFHAISIAWRKTGLRSLAILRPAIYT